MSRDSNFQTTPLQTAPVLPTAPQLSTASKPQLPHTPQLPHKLLLHQILPQPPNIKKEVCVETITLPNASRPDMDCDRHVVELRRAEQPDGSWAEYFHFYIMHNRAVGQLNLWTTLVDASGEIHYKKPDDAYICSIAIPAFRRVMKLPEIEWKDPVIEDVDWTKIAEEYRSDPKKNSYKLESAVSQHIRKYNAPPDFYKPVGKIKQGRYSEREYMEGRGRILDYSRRWSPDTSSANPAAKLPLPDINVTCMRRLIINGVFQEMQSYQRIGIFAGPW